MPDDNSRSIAMPTEPNSPSNNGKQDETQAEAGRFSFIKSTQKQIRNLKIEIRHAWKNKDLSKLWSYAVHCIGFISYAIVSVVLAIAMWVAAFFLIFSEKETKGDDSSYMAMVKFVFKIFEVIFMTFFQIFAGIMGWGAYKAKPSQVPWRILGSISKKAKPSMTTQFFGYGTIGFVGIQTVQLISSLV